MSISDDLAIRLAAFIAAFSVMGLAEWGTPRRRAAANRSRRWPTNLGLMALGAVLTRASLPLGTVAAAVFAGERGWGVLAAAGLATTPLGVAAAVVALDFAMYGQHVAMHRLPVLWRLHRVHHADPALDTSTGIRFHPLEVLLSAVFKVGLVLALGAAPAAVVAFEVLLNVSSLFNHANLRLAAGADRIVRAVFVTPDMHSVHHSVDGTDHDRNFGFALAWWDRLCGTYRAEPATGHDSLVIGLPSILPARAQRLGTMLIEPFRGDSLAGQMPPERGRPGGRAAPAGPHQGPSAAGRDPRK